MKRVLIVVLVSLLVVHQILSQETEPPLPRRRHLTQTETQRNTTADDDITTIPEEPIGIIIPLAPAPEPSINPFVDLSQLPLDPTTIPSNDTRPDPYAICCCGRGRYYYTNVPKAVYSDCCCIQECCSQNSSSNLVTSICGAGATTCSGIIIISSVLIVICIIGCILSSVAYKRRRQRLDDVTAASRLGPEGAISHQRQRDSRRRTRQQDADQYIIQTLSSKEIDEMQVRSPDDGLLQRIQEQQQGGGGKDGNADRGDQSSCPICLEKVTITKDNWSVFPCAAQHGCCGDCLKDLVKYTGARASAVAVHCPLCRKLAIVGYPSRRHSDADEHLEQVEEGTFGRATTLGGGGEGGATTTAINEGRDTGDTTTSSDNNSTDNGTTDVPVWRVVR